MRKTKLVLHRLWQLVPVLLAISLVTFVLAQAIPGDPIRVVIGDRAPQSVIDEVRSQYGLDRPLLVQYVLYVRNLLQGDWGPSIVYDVPVLDLIGARMVPPDQAAFEQNVAAVRAQMNESAFAAAWEAGHALSLEQATADACPAHRRKAKKVESRTEVSMSG